MSQIIKEMQTIGEIVQLAQTKVTGEVWDQIVGGSETESTLLRNRQSLDSVAFRPRILRNVTNIDVNSKIFDIPLRLPIFLAPIGSLERLDKNGAITPAIAAKDFGIGSFLSSVSQPDMTATMKQSGGNQIFQLYVRGDEHWVFDQLDKATGLGFKAFCLTVDSAMYGRRERDKLRGHTPPGRLNKLGADPYQASLDWKLVRKIKHKAQIPVILKGITAREDVTIALENEIDCLYVSNHGGRQLDFCAGTLNALQEVASANKKRAQILVDGGISRGTDIIKAICMGADAVCIGRLYCYGLIAGGKEGIIKVLALLEEEIINAMANLGVASVKDLTTEYIKAAPVARKPGLFSAFYPVKIADNEKYNVS